MTVWSVTLIVDLGGQGGAVTVIPRKGLGDST